MMFSSHRGEIEMSKLTPEQIDFLDELRIDNRQLSLIKGVRLHPFMIYHSAYTDGERLVFFDVNGDNRAKYIYYMGGENEAELTTLYKDVAIYEGLEDRLQGFLSEENDALEA